MQQGGGRWEADSADQLRGREVTATPAWRLCTSLRTPLLVHVPHSSAHVPPDVRRSFLLDDDELQAELLAMTDRYVDELFSGAEALGSTLVVNRLSRLVMDPERFPDDEREPMAAKGMGAVYTLTSDGKPLRPATFAHAERSQIMSRFFEPYAAAVEEQVSALLDRFGRCLIVDAHSYPSSPLPYENPDLARADICLGYDAYHVPNTVVEEWSLRCAKAGWTVGRNEPFSGSYVPLRFYRSEPRVRSVMVEVNRGRYMDEKTGKRGYRFDEVQRLVGDLLRLGLENV